MENKKQPLRKFRVHWTFKGKSFQIEAMSENAETCGSEFKKHCKGVITKITEIPLNSLTEQK